MGKTYCSAVLSRNRLNHLFLGRADVIYLRVLSAGSPFIFLFLLCTTSVADHIRDLPVVAANDNRRPAGELKGGELRLRLEVRKALWYPDRETDPFIALNAFGEVRKAPKFRGHSSACLREHKS
jgi:hypothetical protein